MEKNGDRNEGRLKRSDRLLFRKFNQYLLPTMITYAALSLNEFVDSMLVSNLLGSDAMAIVNLGMPIMLVMAAAYSLLGNGGSTVYAISIGKREHEAAGKSLTAAVILALLAGVIIMLPGRVFTSSLASMLCKEAALIPKFEEYLSVLSLSAPFMVVILTVVSFLPSAGYPTFSTAINVIANVINIVMDYVYIRYFHMGVEGAAWATLTGYICAAAVIVIAAVAGRMKLYVSKNIKEALKDRSEILRLGRPDAINQIGLSIQFAVCNRLASVYAGANGVVAFSLALQSSSLMSVFIGGVIGASIPILAVLHGQKDYHGEEYILRTSMLTQLGISAAGMMLLIVFASRAAAFYNIVDAEQLAMSVYALRIYSLMYIPRDAVIVHYRYLKIIGFERYSAVLSALDSFAAIIPIALILCPLFGINGLWYTFPLAATLLAVFWLIRNLRIAEKSDGALKGPMLYETGEASKALLDVTISDRSEEISDLSIKLQELCEENGISKIDAVKAAMAVEEIAVYVSNRLHRKTHADIIVRLNDGNIEIDFRSLGSAFNPYVDEDGDISENVRVLRSIASSIENEYILGMNSTRITIKGIRE